MFGEGQEGEINLRNTRIYIIKMIVTDDLTQEKYDKGEKLGSGTDIDL